jgi:hypothetical protein
MIHTTQRTCVFGLAIFWLVGAAGAQSTSPIALPEIRTFGMVGLTEGQTARLNLLNPGVPSHAVTSAICPAQLSFLNALGVVLKTTTVSVIPGKSVFFDLDRDIDLAITDERLEIRAAIQIPPVPVANPPQPAVCRLIPTLEVFNKDNGRTQVVLGWAHFVSGPLPAAANP